MFVIICDLLYYNYIMPNKFYLSLSRAFRRSSRAKEAPISRSFRAKETQNLRNFRAREMSTFGNGPRNTNASRVPTIASLARSTATITTTLRCVVFI